jgi:hypothetical protein
MLKPVLLVLAGLGAGLVIAFWLQPGATPATADTEIRRDSPAIARMTSDDGASAARIAALEDALADEVEQRAALEARVADLAVELEALGAQPVRALRGTDTPEGRLGPAAIAEMAEMRTRVRGDPGERREEAERRFVERLVGVGFTPDRAEWITRRTEELRMEALQAQYEAQRGGRPAEPKTLRAELGDVDYERYLQADGRPTAIPVRDVLASSPAERSGLQPGDEIVAYGGKRVFDMGELNALTLEGVPGESVVVDVRRNGQSLQLVMPRGPLGVTGGGFRGR